MKVVCRNISHLINGPYSLLTVGKTYDVISYVSRNGVGDDIVDYMILDDTGIKRYFNKARFELVSDIRDKRIKEILE